MTRVCINEGIINTAFTDLKAQARREWRAKGFNPIEFIRFLEVAENEDIRLVITFDIPGQGNQELCVTLAPETKAPNPEND